MNILIIDDEKDIGFILCFELKLGGHQAVTFEDPTLAQTYYLENKDKIDAIICDFQMPKMSGLNFFEWVRENNYTGPFYILTGEPNMDTQHLLSLGVTKVLFKPHDLNKLTELLKS